MIKLAENPEPTAADKLCASALIARLNQVSHLPDAMIFDAAAHEMMEHRLACERAFALRKDALRAAAVGLLISLHKSVGHTIPEGYPVPDKPLHELVNDLEDALFPESARKPATG